MNESRRGSVLKIKCFIKHTASRLTKWAIAPFLFSSLAFALVSITSIAAPSLAIAENKGMLRAAIATNFIEPAKAIKTRFENDTGYRVELSFASSGKLYAQIKHGAPFDIILSADQRIPSALIAKGLANKSDQFTYAIGQLVLWSPNPDVFNTDTAKDYLKQSKFDKLALANPKLAPYGRAAQEVLTALSVDQKIKGKIVKGESVAHAFQFTLSKNVQLGFVSLSQLQKITNDSRDIGSVSDSGSVWLVPETYYTPIKQDAVILKHGQKNPAAVAFYEYLQQPSIRALIRSFGYKTVSAGT